MAPELHDDLGVDAEAIHLGEVLGECGEVATEGRREGGIVLLAEAEPEAGLGARILLEERDLGPRRDAPIVRILEQRRTRRIDVRARV